MPEKLRNLFYNAHSFPNSLQPGMPTENKYPIEESGLTVV
jgi:hypothetical protein